MSSRAFSSGSLEHKAYGHHVAHRGDQATRMKGNVMSAPFSYGSALGPNPSVKRPPTGVPVSAAYLKR